MDYYIYKIIKSHKNNAIKFGEECSIYSKPTFFLNNNDILIIKKY